MLQYREGLRDSGFNQTPIFALEENFDGEKFFYWIRENWTLSFWYSVVYLIIIFGVKYVMKDRSALTLRPALALWSAALAVFSIAGSARTIPELIYVLNNYGWNYSICNASYYIGTTEYWIYLFWLSKSFELGDTIFIVLKKQKLIFLHWYHHFTVLIYAWFICSRYIGAGRYQMVMNFSVHAVMYSYYVLKALKVKVPKLVSISITTLQISQVSSIQVISILKACTFTMIVLVLSNFWML